MEDALRNLWSVANDLSRIKPTRPSAYRVSIFGSARIEPGEPLYQEVKELARRLAELGCDIVTGGGPGLMQAANEGAQLGDPGDRVRSIGVRIALPFEQGANPFVEKLYSHRTFFTRLHQFMRLSSAFVVVGGGIGTLLETTMVWQLLQVGHLRDVPLVFVGTMWKELVAWGRAHMAEREPQPFASAEDFDIPVCVDTVDEAVAALRPAVERFQRAAERGVGVSRRGGP
ncbi:MAG: LOG family protein [Deltaproteobacteria bacterium]|nr:LOG family protein [Deltaproteobacteria bacterium]MBW2534250.1 LOG family protein [Deltaproteobacteria bacterium]